MEFQCFPPKNSIDDIYRDIIAKTLSFVFTSSIMDIRFIKFNFAYFFLTFMDSRSKMLEVNVFRNLGCERYRTILETNMVEIESKISVKTTERRKTEHI
jgi:hypothetical protein